MRYRILLVYSLLVFSCHNEEIIPGQVKIITDKTTYMNLESIIVEVENDSADSLEFFICSGKYFPTYDLEKFDNGWQLTYSQSCNGFNSLCCGVLRPEEKLTDTIYSNWLDELDEGVYRFKYRFRLDGSKVFYSNQFRIN